MSPVDKERMKAALELVGCVQGLITTDTVPPFMVDFLRSRCARVQRSFGAPVVSLVPDLESAAANEAVEA